MIHLSDIIKTGAYPEEYSYQLNYAYPGCMENIEGDPEDQRLIFPIQPRVGML